MKTPNVTARQNDFGGTDVNHFGGNTVRIAFNDGQTEIFVFDLRMVHQYEAKFSYLTPWTLVNNVISATLLNALGVRGAQRDELMTKVSEARSKSLARWKRENNI